MRIKMKNINKLLLLNAAAFTFSANVFALVDNQKDIVSIPMIENAQVFAEFTDDVPAVLNYFTTSKEAQIINFYQQQYGKALSQERKRDRLTLKFQQKNYDIRVVISQQNNKHQVDVIVVKKI